MGKDQSFDGNDSDFGKADFDYFNSNQPNDDLSQVNGPAGTHRYNAEVDKLEKLTLLAIDGNGPAVRKVVEGLEQPCDQEKLLAALVVRAKGKLLLSTDATGDKSASKPEGLYRTGESLPIITIENKHCQ